jgi:hypothetical protein
MQSKVGRGLWDGEVSLRDLRLSARAGLGRTVQRPSSSRLPTIGCDGCKIKTLIADSDTKRPNRLAMVLTGKSNLWSAAGRKCQLTSKHTLEAFSPRMSIQIL